mmetsp:Transcript_47605/g.157784  ORF Transcript_47605/g.157784 Transcript_47605/m.157784 type:complete len:201 (+) Transcript_47605:222-824(+)
MPSLGSRSGGSCPPQGGTSGSRGGVGIGARSCGSKTPSSSRCCLSHGSAICVLPSWLPSVVQPLCTLCGRPKSSSLRWPGASRSSRSYISSGLRDVSRTSAQMTSQSRFWLNRSSRSPLTPMRQCSLEWLIQWPVRPVRMMRCSWLVLTQSSSCTKRYPQISRHSRPSSIARPVTHRKRTPSSCSTCTFIRRISSSDMVP